ncbi:GNAT family N-acetyltransferase [Arthrobacter sp. UM1]|nr:GNAT family N-acetyltransferase [Arthrobacter sp. UM1]
MRAIGLERWSSAVFRGVPRGHRLRRAVVYRSPSSIADAEGRRYRVRRAREEDLPEIVRLLLDDRLGADRETAWGRDPEADARYLRAFEDIDDDGRQHLAVLEEADASAPGLCAPVSPLPGPRAPRLAGTMQLTVTPGLSHQGAERVTVEAVRVDSALRGGGLGSAFVRWAVEDARSRGAQTVQLTSNASRTDAHRFYERLGFAKSHTGFKLQLGEG